MQIEKASLQKRIDLLNAGYTAHPEYVAATIYRFADLPMSAYFHGLEGELAKLKWLAGGAHTDIQNMTYKQLAHRLDDELYNTPSCGDGYLYDAIALFALPLIKAQGGQTECEGKEENPQGRKAAQRISLDERLKDSITLKSCIMPAMNIDGFLPFMDEMVSPRGVHFTRVYERHFQQYGDKTFAALISESAQMPEDERRTVQYHLLVEPFAKLETSPRAKWRQK